MTKTESFDDYVNRVDRGKPYLSVTTKGRTGFVIWGDGTLWDYSTFGVAIDTKALHNELHAMFVARVPKTRRRAELWLGSLGGLADYVPPDVALDMFALIRVYFLRALAAMIDAGIHRGPMKWEEHSRVIDKLCANHPRGGHLSGHAAVERAAKKAISKRASVKSNKRTADHGRKKRSLQ